MSNSGKLTFDFTDILKMISRRWYIIISSIIVMFLLSSYYGNKNNSISYTARTSVIIGNPLNSGGNQYSIEDVQKIQVFMGTYSALSRSTDVMDKVIKKLNLKVSPETLQGSITAEAEKDTQFMDLRIVWPNQQEAVLIINAVADTFVENAKSLYPTVDIKVMVKADNAKMASGSNKSMYMVLGIVSGIMISLLIIFALEWSDATLKSEEDIMTWLGIPVIGNIPKSKEKMEEIKTEFFRELNGSTVEAYRILRTNLHFILSESGSKAVAVTSGKAGEGKTTTASILAAAIALTGKRTLLIDCDLRTSSIHRMFNLDNKQGLTDVLMSKIKLYEAICKSSTDNLFILTAGSKSPNSSELLASDMMKEIITITWNEFEFVILDTPSVGFIADTLILSKMVDGYILVVASGEAKRKDTIRAKAQFQKTKGKILGVSLNKTDDGNLYKWYRYYMNIKLKKDSNNGNENAVIKNE